MALKVGQSLISVHPCIPCNRRHDKLQTRLLIRDRQRRSYNFCLTWCIWKYLSINNFGGILKRIKISKQSVSMGKLTVYLIAGHSNVAQRVTHSERSSRSEARKIRPRTRPYYILYVDLGVVSPLSLRHKSCLKEMQPNDSVIEKTIVNCECIHHIDIFHLLTTK